MQILYGHDIPEEGDIYVTLADQAMTSFGKAGLFGTYLVDYIPLRTSLVVYHLWVTLMKYRQSNMFRVGFLEHPSRNSQDNGGERHGL